MAPGLVTKYEAIEELQARHRTGTVIFVGDDVTDERVFERAPADWLTVRVWDDGSGRVASVAAVAARAFVQRRRRRDRTAGAAGKAFAEPIITG